MVCSKCGGYVPPKENNYSIEHFGKSLCFACQPELHSQKEKSFLKKKKRSTPEAIKLFKILVKMGFDAKLEQDDGFKHIDIAIPKFMVNIEVDGMHHQYNKKQAITDLKRTFYSFRKGYVTLRIPNKLIQEEAYNTAKYIREFINASAEQLKD
ncbi:MAG: endonuclease domain-containing protein [Nanoarchaeota archaeon]|nr:endonuclease domain-containing protein [Nanoarchaeota archaeon]